MYAYLSPVSSAQSVTSKYLASLCAFMVPKTALEDQFLSRREPLPPQLCLTDLPPPLYYGRICEQAQCCRLEVECRSARLELVSSQQLIAELTRQAARSACRVISHAGSSPIAGSACCSMAFYLHLGSINRLISGLPICVKKLQPPRHVASLLAPRICRIFRICKHARGLYACVPSTKA